jgi:hypothetical protein
MVAQVTAKAAVARTRLTDILTPVVIDDDEQCIIHGAAREEGTAPGKYRNV